MPSQESAEGNREVQTRGQRLRPAHGQQPDVAGRGERHAGEHLPRPGEPKRRVGGEEEQQRHRQDAHEERPVREERDALSVVEEARADEHHDGHEAEEDGGGIEVERHLVGLPHPPANDGDVRAGRYDREDDDAELGQECGLTRPGTEQPHGFRGEPHAQRQRDPAPNPPAAAHGVMPTAERKGEADRCGPDADDLGARGAAQRDDRREQGRQPDRRR